jgi:E3 ubiquitin-protein ligase makorin
MKKEIVDRYLSRLKNIPCRYFEKSIEDSRDSMPTFRPKCKFGNSCHYAHKHPITKEPYTFSEEEMNRGRRRPRQRRHQISEEIAMMEAIFNSMGGGYGSDDDWGCEDEDFAFFESSSIGFGYGHDLDFDEFDHNYGWD